MVVLKCPIYLPHKAFSNAAESRTFIIATMMKAGLQEEDFLIHMTRSKCSVADKTPCSTKSVHKTFLQGCTFFDTLCSV